MDLMLNLHFQRSNELAQEFHILRRPHGPIGVPKRQI